MEDAGALDMENKSFLTSTDWIDNKSKLIKYISSKSNRYGDKLVDFLTMYNLTGLIDATVEQLSEYIRLHM